MYWVFIEHHALAIRLPALSARTCCSSRCFKNSRGVFISRPHSSQASIHVASGPRRKGQRSQESVSSEAWMYASFFTRRCQMLGNADSQAVRSACMAFLPVSIVFMRIRRTFCAKASDALCGPRTGNVCSFCHNSCTSSKTFK